MYVKVFSQILDSSIADDHLVRWVFEDLLKLADKDGLVDMTAAAIARRTNVPIETVLRGVERLSAPDPTSRSMDEEGRRIVLIDPHRPWGWRIVNYLHYRGIRDGEDRKAYFRERKREQRARSKTVLDTKRQSTNVTQAEADAREQRQGGEARKRARGPSPSTQPEREEVRLAREVLKACDHPTETGLVRMAAEAITLLTKRNGIVGLPAASDILKSRILTSPTRGETVNRLWFEDQKWDPRLVHLDSTHSYSQR